MSNFDLGSFDVTSAVNQVTNALTKGVLGPPIKSINDFINKVSTTTSLARKEGQSLAHQDFIKAISSRPDPSLSFDWIGLILDPTVSTSAQLPWEYIDGITTPAVSITTEEVFMNGRVRKYATKYDVQTADIKIYSDVNGLGFNFANTWARSAYRQDGFWNLPKAYKKDIQIFVIDATRSIIVDFRLVGCTVTNWNGYNLDSSDTPLETSLTLSVDDFYMNYDSDFTAAKSSLNSILTTGLNAGIANLTTALTSGVSSAISGIFGSDTGFNII